MSVTQRVPTFGDWNNPNAQNNYGYTTTFEVVRRDKRTAAGKGKSPVDVDHIPINPQTILDHRTQHQPKRPSTSSGISDRVRPPAYDNDDNWETQSTRSAPDNSVPQTRQSRRPPAYHQTERMRNYLSTAQHQQVPTTEDHSTPKVRHEQSPAQYQQVQTNGDCLRIRHERQRVDASSGKTSTDPWNITQEAGHLTEGRRRDMPSSREEETYNKPRNPNAFGYWNIDPNTTPEYTMKFDALRKRKHKNNVSEPEPLNMNNPAPQIQAYSTDTSQEIKTNQTKISCFDCFFPRLKI